MYTEGNMKKIIFAALAAAMGLAVSCQKDNDNMETGKTEVREVSINAVMEPGASVRSTETDGKFAWAGGDAISVYTSAGSFKKFILDSESAGKSEGIFTGTLNNGEVMEDYAVYPYSGSHRVENGNLIVNFPAEYGDFNTEYAANTNALMIAELTNETIDDNEASFTFNHVAGVLRIAFKGMPQKAAKVVFTADTGITGDFNVNTDSEGNKIVNTVAATETNKTVAISFKPLAATVEDEMVFYFPLPVGTYNEFTVSIQDKDGKTGWTKTVSGSSSIKRKNLSRLPVLTLDIDEVFLTLSDKIERGGERVIDSAVEVIDFKGLNIAKDLTLILNAAVGEIKVGGNTDSNNITIEVKKDVEYPAFTFNQGTKNLTIKGDLETSKPLTKKIDVKHSNYVTFTNIKATGSGQITTHEDGAYTDVNNLTVKNCVATDMDVAFVKLGGPMKDAKILNNTIAFKNSAVAVKDNDMVNHAIYMYFLVGNVLIEGNTITKTPKHGIYANYPDGDVYLTIKNNNISGVVEDCIKTDLVNNVIATGNVLDAPEFGIRFDRLDATPARIPANFTISDNTISTNGANGASAICVRFRQLENAPNTITVNLTAKDNKAGTGGIPNGQDYSFTADSGTTMTLTGDYSTPFITNN